MKTSFSYHYQNFLYNKEIPIFPSSFEPKFTDQNYLVNL